MSKTATATAIVVSHRVRPGLYAVGTPTGQYTVEDVTGLAAAYGDTDASVTPIWRVHDVTGSFDEWVGDTATKRAALALIATL